MSAKPSIQSTAPLSREESRELVRAVTSVSLSESRRETLSGYAQAAQTAFAKRTVR
jgi:hypothetical protein